MSNYPKLEVNLGYLKHNVKTVVDKCAEKGIEVTGVVKGAAGLQGVSMAFSEGGVASIGSSRLEQLEDARAVGIQKFMVLLRVPMLSEVRDVINVADGSLNSEIEVIKALNEEAMKRGKVHSVILMADLGDLREGYWDKDELLEVAYEVENKMDNIKLAGIGTNLGCYGSVLPTVDKLQELVDLAKKVEDKIGRKLDYISGGATSSYMRVLDGNIPKGINHLRIGEEILIGIDIEEFYGYDEKEIHKDVFTLKAEVIEVKEKPSYPVGELGVDAFGRTQVYEDKGMRRKALLAVGKVDYGDPADLIVKEKGIEVLGASSDHTILDVTEMERQLKVGDIVEFGVRYSTIVYLSSSRNVKLSFV